MDLACDEAALQQYHPTAQLVGVVRNLISLQNVTITLEGLVMEEVFESGDTLINRIVRTYAMQLTLQLYKLIGSLDLLGNPGAVFADVGGGVKQFFQTKDKRAVGHLAGVLLGGTGALTFGAFGGISREFSHATAALAFDDKYNQRRHLTLQKQVETTKRGIYVGGQLLGGGIISGLAGVVRQPYKGAREGGARGFAMGMGKGAIGLLAKPSSGLAGAFSKTAEGVASDAKRATAPTKQDVLRMRQPRELQTGHGAGSTSVLMAYPRGSV